MLGDPSILILRRYFVKTLRILVGHCSNTSSLCRPEPHQISTDASVCFLGKWPLREKGEKRSAQLPAYAPKCRVGGPATARGKRPLFGRSNPDTRHGKFPRRRERGRDSDHSLNEDLRLQDQPPTPLKFMKHHNL